MPSISVTLQLAFARAIRAAFDVDADPLVAPSQNEAFGDYQSNAAMKLAGLVGERAGRKVSPREVAAQIVAKLDLGEMVDTPLTPKDIAGPGFINVRLSPKWLAERLADVAADERLGVPRAEKPQTVVVDYSGVNIAKQMHVGHLRSTIIGDAIVRTLRYLGHTVIGQNHLGDWGTQFGMLIAFMRSEQKSADAGVDDLDAFYKAARQKFDSDPAFAEEARRTVVRLQAGGADEIAMWRKIVAASRRHYQPIYGQLDVLLTERDECGESFYNPMLAGVVDELVTKGLATTSEGATVVFTEGEAAPLIVRKSDGGFGYATTDLAGVKHRVGTLRGERLVYVIGNPQSQHLRQVFWTARRAGWADGVVIEHVGFGSVLGADGKMFRARSGESVKLADLLNEAEDRAMAVVRSKNPDLPETQAKAVSHAIGVGAVKYADLSKDRVGDYTFDWDTMLAFDGNTAPYLQYAHARVKSIFRKAGEPASAGGVSRATIVLDSPYELALAKHLLRFGDVVESVGRELKPHVLTGYLYELAARFSGFFENCPVLKSEGVTRASRLALCAVTARVLEQGLDLLGIGHPDEM